MLSDKTLRLSIRQQLSDTRFMYYQLQNGALRSQIEGNATGSSGSMKNISQREIVAILSAHDATIRSLQDEAARLREVKHGLMQQLLSGEVRV